MITTGSKFFFAITAILGAILSLELTVHLLSPSAYVFGMDTTSSIIMTSVMVACAFLGGISIATRDGDNGTDVAAFSASVPHASKSLWPMVTGVALMLMGLGLVADKRIFGLGMVALLACGFEWVVQGWTDRASGDAAHNAAVRSRFLHPIEFPVLGFLIVGAVMFGLSRIMLSLSEVSAMTLFGVVAAIILFVALGMAQLKQGLSRTALAGVLGAGVVMLAVFSIVGINRGEHLKRGEHAAGHESEVEKPATNAVANKANTFASVNAEADHIEVRHDGIVLEHLSVPRALTSSLLFRNETGEKAQLVVHSVKVVTNAEGESEEEAHEFATEYIGEGKSKVLTINMPKSSNGKPFKMEVVTESGKKIESEIEVR